MPEIVGIFRPSQSDCFGRGRNPGRSRRSWKGRRREIIRGTGHGLADLALDVSASVGHLMQRPLLDEPTTAHGLSHVLARRSGRIFLDGPIITAYPASAWFVGGGRKIVTASVCAVPGFWLKALRVLNTAKLVLTSRRGPGPKVAYFQCTLANLG